jgi:hypothetical protein
VPADIRWPGDARLCKVNCVVIEVYDKAPNLLSKFIVHMGDGPAWVSWVAIDEGGGRRCGRVPSDAESLLVGIVLPAI